MRLLSDIEAKSNLSLIFRERGKIVARRDGHNIWVNLGREYLAQLLAYASYSPLTAETDHRIRYMGFGIGGTRQTALVVANAAPYVTDYPGTNLQTDTDPAVTAIERPVRLSWTTGPTSPPYDAADVWLGQIAAPPTHPVATQVKFVRLFTESDISSGIYSAVPLSEIGLFTNAANPNVYNNTFAAYDTFDTITKTDAFSIEVSWTIRF